MSKDQKAFNDLIRKIEARRVRLGEWERAFSVFRQKYASDLSPMRRQARDLQRRLARALDAIHDRKGMTKGEKRKLAALIVGLTEDVLTQEDQDDEIKALFNKYNPSDFDEQEAERLNDVKTMLESALGMDLGDDIGTVSPDEFLHRVETRFRKQRQEEEQAPRRKKSRREEARAVREEAEEKQLSQSIRDVFRKLASALHPDREADPTEKARKTVLMQRANQAYDQGNLLQLLELQLELEHIDQAHLAAIRPERLKRYIKILKGQAHELDMEIRRVVEQLSFEFGISTWEPVLPGDLLPMLQEDIVNCRAQIADLRRRLETAADPQGLKAWLKTLTLRRRTSYQDYGFPF